MSPLSSYSLSKDSGQSSSNLPLLVSPSYGDSVANTKGTQVHWRKVQQCTKIVQTWCDLSNELWDLEQGYYARVRAVSRRSSSIWTLTRRFDPKSDSKFTVTFCVEV